MRARVTTFYRLLGVASLPNDGNLDLFEDQGLSVRIYLTMNAQPVNDLLNMASAAGTVAFAHFTGALSGDTPPERYQSAIALLAKRNPPAPSGAC